ncbi:1,4-dihydroxy-2-naphthoyl-CoA synthase [Streptomyces alboniger]
MSPFTGSAARTPRWEHLRVDLADGVATVTLARPDKLNALTFGAYADLRDLLAELSRERSVRALVLAGEGRGFCSGGDVDEIIGATLAMDTAQLLDFNRMTGQVVRAVRECPFPVIAAVHGVAAGAGAVLALAADFRVADPTARFAFLFSRVGLSGGDMGAAYLLPRVVGLGHATRLLMLGEPVRAPEDRADRPDQRADGRGAGGRGRPGTGSPPRRGPGPRVRPDEGPADGRAGHAAGRSGGAGRLDPGTVDARRGLRRVPQGIQGEALSQMERTVTAPTPGARDRASMRLPSRGAVSPHGPAPADDDRPSPTSSRSSAAAPEACTRRRCSKRLDPDREITLWERNAPTDTFGFGVVLSDETLGGIEHADPVVHEALQRHFVRWDDIDIVHRGTRHTSGGHGFAALGRRRLLEILHERCRSLGVQLRFRSEAPYPAWLTETHDLVIAADGVHSTTREAYAPVFRPHVAPTTAAMSGWPPTSPSTPSASRSPRPSTA